MKEILKKKKLSLTNKGLGAEYSPEVHWLWQNAKKWTGNLLPMRNNIKLTQRKTWNSDKHLTFFLKNNTFSHPCNFKRTWRWLIASKASSKMGLVSHSTNKCEILKRRWQELSLELWSWKQLPWRIHRNAKDRRKKMIMLITHCRRTQWSVKNS